MPSHTITIEEYRPQLSRSPNSTIRRSMWLNGPRDQDRTPDNAIIYFAPGQPTLMGFIGVPQPPFQNFGAQLHMALDEFDTMYHVLQTESPMHLTVNYESAPINPGSRNHRVTSFWLSTETEPIGEGFGDADAP